jgi:broad specificity phosphatase PhoE
MEARPLSRWMEGFPGGETFDAFQRRVAAGADEWLGQLGVRLGKLSEGATPGPDERVCLVCHAGVTAVLVAHLTGVQPVPYEWYRFGMGFTGVTHLRTRPLGDAVIATLTLFNCRKHLE